jgi:RHS repeat-associated protein
VVSFIPVDHIEPPMFATNTAGTKVWTASTLPFGGVRTTTGTPITARFPGEWFQSKSGLHQNWMRDDDPTTGRYLQADPLGLVDGASVYGYAHQSPMMLTDPRGEDTYGRDGPMSFPVPIWPGSLSPRDYSRAWEELLDLSGRYNPVDLLLQSIVEACTACPACSPYNAGTIGYRWDNHATNAPGVGSDHLNLYIVNQNPTTCKCFWNANDPYHVNPPPNPSWVFLPSTGRYGSRTSFPPLSP